MILKTLKEKWAEYVIEIVVIAISIFSGLQLDNWNEYQQDRELERKYLIRLSNDLAEDTLYYYDRIQRTKKLLRDYKQFIVSAYQTQSSLNDFLNLMKDIDLPSEQLVTQNSTYIELINNGTLNLIGDDELKTQVVELQRQIDIAKNHFSEYNAFTADLLLHANTKINIIKYLVKFKAMLPWEDYSNYRDSEWEFINHHESEKFQVMENLIAMYYHKHEVFIKYLEDLKVRTIAVRKMINAESIK